MKHERFIMGQGESGRLYLVHTQTPRFVAEIDGDDEVQGAGFHLPISTTGDVVWNFAWIDSRGDTDVDQLRDDVEAFIEESDFRGEQEISRQLE